MEISRIVTVTTAEVVVLIRNASGTIIMEKTLPLPIPEGISEQMTDIKVETVIDKHEYRLASTVRKTLAPDGTIINTDYIDQTF